MGDFFQTLRSLLGLEETPDQKRLRESLERPPAKRGVPPMLARPPRPPSFLGEQAKPQSSFRDGSALIPPSLPKIQNPMERIKRHQLDRDTETVNEPGAQVLDFMPAEPLTPEEERVMSRAHSDKGFTYRPPMRAKGSLPQGTKTIGPLGNRVKRGK